VPDGGGTLLTEAGAAVEYAALLADPVYRGVGVPRGDGRPVAVLPGLFANDLYLTPLRDWLRRVGYTPVRSALAINAGCPERLSRTIAEQIERAAGGAGKVAIIGHSRGGILGWAVANRMGSRVSHLILLGSPAAMVADGVRAGGSWQPSALGAVTRGVRAASDRARALLDPECDFPACGCPYTAAMAMPLDFHTRLVAIASSDDAIVPADFAAAPHGENHVDRGSHSGLAANASVYRLLGAILAGQETPRP
jgi:pimeloyl-ACP methyl ester carboxylesterase